MNKNILSKSIVLIGPKQVGKSFFAENLIQEQNTPDFVLSSDLLTNLIIYHMSGNWRELVEMSELKEIGQQYKSIFNFDELAPFVQSLAQCQQSPKLDDKSKKVAMSYWKARLLEEATRMLNKPYILDAGADIGAVIDLSETQKNDVSNFFFMPFFVIEDRMKSFLNQFCTRIYLKPEPSYKSLEGRAQDAENAIYLESGKSYEPYASHIVDCNNLYHTGKPKEKAVKSVIKSLNLSQTPPVFGE